MFSILLLILPDRDLVSGRPACFLSLALLFEEVAESWLPPADPLLHPHADSFEPAAVILPPCSPAAAQITGHTHANTMVRCIGHPPYTISIVFHSVLESYVIETDAGNRDGQDAAKWTESFRPNEFHKGTHFLWDCATVQLLLQQQLSITHSSENETI